MKKKSLWVGTLAAASLLMASCGKGATGSTITRVTAIERLSGINANVTVSDFNLPNSVTMDITNKAPTVETVPAAYRYDSNSHYFYAKYSSTDAGNPSDSSEGDSPSFYVENWEYIISPMTILKATNHNGTKTYSTKAFKDYSAVTSAWKDDTNDTLDIIYSIATETSGSFLDLLNDLNSGSYSAGKETYNSTGDGNLSLSASSLSIQSGSPISSLNKADTVGAKFNGNLPTYVSLVNSSDQTETDETITWNQCEIAYPVLKDYNGVSSSSSGSSQS